MQKSPQVVKHVVKGEKWACSTLKAGENKHTAAIMIEFIQGESGVNPITEEFAKTIREICDKEGILFIDDEVQTGDRKSVV